MEKQKTSHKVAQELLQRDSPRAQRRHATRLWQLTRRAAKPSRLPLTMKSFSWFPAARPHGQPAPSDALGAEGAEQRGAGSEAPKLGPETGRALRARWRVGGAGEGAWSRVSAARRRRNGRVAPYAAARLTGRARGRAGRQNAGNSPAHPTSLFSPQSARGEPRHVGCSALSTTSARSTSLSAVFHTKTLPVLGRSRV